MFCQKCGTESPDNGNFCQKCGTDLKSTEQAERKGISGKLGKWGIPGFRSGKTWKMALATFIYFFVFLSIISGSSTEPPAPTQTPLTNPIATPTPTISITYESTPIQTEVVKIDDKIKIEYSFGCVRYCSSDSGPSESDNIFYIQNAGTSTLHNFKVVIDFYRASGDYYSSKSSTEIQDIEPNTESSVFLQVPFQYIGKETWTYAKLYILEDGTRYYLTDWKSKNSGMPPINGTFVTTKKQ